MFTTKEENWKIRDAVLACNSYSLQQHIYESIRDAESFDMSTALPVYLSRTFKRFFKTHTAEVVVYYPKWIFSRANGYYSASEPNIIHINGFKLRHMYPIELARLMMHEKGHYQDAVDEKESYNHGTGRGRNNPKGKENTYQYSLGRFVYDFYSYTPRKYTPWYKRILRWF